MASDFCLYKHTSPNGKVYIGITCQNPTERWGKGKGYNKQFLFYRAIQKYGWENFKHEILFKNLSKEEACQKEIELIAKYKSNNPEFGYNITSGGEGISGYHHTEEAKKLIGLSSKNNQYGKGYHHTAEAKNKISIFAKNRIRSYEELYNFTHSRIGVSLTPEHRQAISNAQKGNKNMLGKHHSQETKDKISKKMKYREVSEETRKKLSIASKKQWEKYRKNKEENKNGEIFV